MEGNEPEVDDFNDPEALPEGQDTFDRKYVEELRAREAKYRVKARDITKEVADLGGLDSVKEAARIRDQLQTDDGVVAMFIESGRALGLGVEQMETLFGEAEAAANKDAKELGEKPLTKAEVIALLQEQVLNPLAQRDQESQAVVARQTIDSTVRGLGMDPKSDTDDIDIVLRLADKYLDANDMNPTHIAAAVEKGFADFGKLSSERHDKYVKDKRETKAKVPSSTAAGSAAGGTDLPEPANVAEARERARARLRAAAGN
jgi:hypothetical protein